MTETCDSCGQVIGMDEVGYMGPADGSDRCDPFLPFRTLCRPCAKEWDRGADARVA